MDAQTLHIGLTILAGGGGALQAALIGALSRQRGPGGAGWVSLLASLTGMAVLLGLRSARGIGPALPAPFDRPQTLALVALATGAMLALALRGLPPYFAVTGLPAVGFIFAASTLGPRLGLGLFLGSAIAGQLGGAVVLDHVGAFGAVPRPVDAVRLAGVASLMLGLVLVRGVR